MKYLKPKYIRHLTPGLIFKANNFSSIYCVVNNKKVLYIHPGGNGAVFLDGQNRNWAENCYKLVLADKKVIEEAESIIEDNIGIEIL